MEPLIIAAAAETPSVSFNGQLGTFNFSGKSYPENVNDFYKPILEYIELYKTNPKENTLIEFNWLYYNTATSKMIIKILVLFKSINTNLSIKWLCKSDNELMIEKGEEIKEVLDLNFDIVHI
ncbi:MAG TPA: DUF1987 domain-containing protein [Bacteroidia bacterium]|nr:DUF1987 domain-containing protein [Bacteroidia bacterium]